MRLVVRIALCMLVASPLLAQRNSPYELPIREHVYPNGLRLLVVERPGDRRVAAKIFTDMGTTDWEAELVRLAREYFVSENRTVGIVRSLGQTERETTSGRSR